MSGYTPDDFAAVAAPPGGPSAGITWDDDADAEAAYRKALSNGLTESAIKLLNSHGSGKYKSGSHADFALMGYLHRAGLTLSENVAVIFDHPRGDDVHQRHRNVRSYMRLSLSKIYDEGSQTPATESEPDGSQADRPFNYRTLTEIAENPIPAPPIQIEGLCRQGEVYILTGPYDGLKSTTIAELAACVASGRPVFGRFNVLRPGKALIVQNEIHPGVYDERMMRHADLDANWMDNLLLISREDFRIDEQSMLLLDNIIAQEQLTFIGLDPLSEMYPDDQGFDENNPTQITALLNRLKVVRDKNITIGFAHHDPKNTERRARGSGRLMDAPDLRILMSPTGKKGFEIARAKVIIRSRTLPRPDDFDIVLGSDRRLRYEIASLTDEQEQTLDVVRRLANGTTQDVAAALGVDYNTAYSRLTRLRAKGKAKSNDSRPARWSTA